MYNFTDGLNDKSPLASPSEEVSGNSFSSSSLLLPLGSHLETPLKPRQGPEVKRTIAHPLDKVKNFYCCSNVVIQIN